MKQRNGFVSNSSSSSFIVRGARVKKSIIAEALKIDIDEVDYSDAEKLGKGFVCEENRYYFGGKKSDETLVGIKLEAEDGEVLEVQDDEERDKEIIKGLEKLGIKNVKLSTFFRYISNDNY
jgi:hypothetical protein